MGKRYRTNKFPRAGIQVTMRNYTVHVLCVFPHAEIHVPACISACGNISLEVEVYRVSECLCTCRNM